MYSELDCKSVGKMTLQTLFLVLVVTKFSRPALLIMAMHYQEERGRLLLHKVKTQSLISYIIIETSLSSVQTYPLKLLQQKLKETCRKTNRKQNSSIRIKKTARPSSPRETLRISITAILHFQMCAQHAEVTTQVNSATWKLRRRMEGVGMELLSSWTSAQAQLTPKCIFRKLVRLLWWQTRTPMSGTPSVARNLSEMTVMGMTLPLIQ